MRPVMESWPEQVGSPSAALESIRLVSLKITAIDRSRKKEARGGDLGCAHLNNKLSKTITSSDWNSTSVISGIRLAMC